MYLPHIAVWDKDGWSLEAIKIDVKAKATKTILNNAINEIYVNKMYRFFS